VQSIGHTRIVVIWPSAYYNEKFDTDISKTRPVRADMAVTKMQISPVIVNGFENGFHRWSQRIFLVVVEAKNIGFGKFFLKVGSTLRPCSG